MQDIRAWLSEASNTSVAGQFFQVVPSSALFGSPVCAKAAMLAIIVSDNASRPAYWLG